MIRHVDAQPPVDAAILERLRQAHPEATVICDDLGAEPAQGVDRAHGHGRGRKARGVSHDALRQMFRDTITRTIAPPRGGQEA